MLGHSFSLLFPEQLKLMGQLQNRYVVATLTEENSLSDEIMHSSFMSNFDIEFFNSQNSWNVWEILDSDSCWWGCEALNFWPCDLEPH